MAAVLLAAAACVQVPEEPLQQEATVHFTAGTPQTRTAFTTPEGGRYPVLWTAQDSEVTIALNMEQVQGAAVTPSSDFKSARFDATFQAAEAPYSFYLVSPAAAIAAHSAQGWTLTVPEVQTPGTNSVDEKAQILVSEAENLSTMPESVSFTLSHWTAYGRISFANLDLGSAKVSAVELSSELPWAGKWTYAQAGDGRSSAVEGAHVITLQTSSAEQVWFASAPVDLSGTKLTVKVVTDQGDFTKELAMPEGRVLSGGKVALITVDMAGIKPHQPSLKIERVWGKYSTASASWNEYYGGTANADRNLAMDDEYIYLPETTAAAKLWRMSLDGKTVTEANVEGVTGGTFAIGCVRMVPNTSSKVNGGKDFLMGVSLTVGDNTQPVYVYSYDEGTDHAPKRTSASTWCGRRLGDKFTGYGSLQDGGLFFKDFNNVADPNTLVPQGAFMVLKTAWSVAPVDGYFNPRRTNLLPESGMGAYYPYPGDVQHGIYTSTSSARYVSLAENPLSVSPNESATMRDAGGYYKDAHGFNFFSFNGKRYVAYAKNADGADGRVYILEGEDSDSWESLLAGKRKVIYQASIQGDVEFFDAEYHPELEVASPRASGHSGLDLTVRSIDGAMYIAVVKQNVGLSLFRMSVQ